MLGRVTGCDAHMLTRDEMLIQPELACICMHLFAGVLKCILM